MAFDAKRASGFIDEAWRWKDHSRGESADLGPITKAIEEFVAIPNISPGFDREWDKNGLLDKAARAVASSLSDLLAMWSARGVKTDDIKIDLIGADDAPLMDGSRRRSPFVHVSVPAFGGADSEGTVLLYGHMDKQPHLDQALWTEEFSPTEAVIKDGRLYGRGGADDGYAPYSAISALMALREQDCAHAESHIIIEGCEESGSEDFDFYLKMLAPELGDVRLIFCIDGICGTYDRLWIANSLRGAVSAEVSVGVLKEGVHSGIASGIVPSSFRIFRSLLSRFEDERTGEVIAHSLRVTIPAEFRRAAERALDVLGREAYDIFPVIDAKMRYEAEDPIELLLNNTWRATVAVTGFDGYPKPADAGNVLLPETRAVVSFRIPPTIDAKEAAREIERIFKTDPPYGAKIDFKLRSAGSGWASVEPASWFDEAIEQSSKEFFGKPAARFGVGASVPIIITLADLYPKCEIMITGVEGPGANAHGPREMLHLPMAAGVTKCIARVIASHAEASK